MSGQEPKSFTVAGHPVPAGPLTPGLYIVATPIGNLADITIRALSTLASADLVACEDTRVTAVLLRHYGIAVPTIAYHDHNAARQRPKLMAALAEGKRVALVSDAGTPLISDPGYRLVVEARAAGHAIVPIPGASALLAALVAAGLPTDAFLFAGFLPPKTVARTRRLKELAGVPATLAFYESPQRLAASLADMAAALGATRAAAVARELTKTFETVRTGTLGELAATYGGEAPPKGEIVVLVGPPEEAATGEAEAEAILKSLLADMPVSAAAARAAELTGLPRRALYTRALALKGESDGGKR